MESKNYTQVLIDGKIYTLGGSEDEGYLQKAASYVNEKKSQMRQLPGFSKQNADYQMVMMELNITDDYFKAVDRADGVERQKNELEKETYSLKHELVSTQIKLEAVLKDLEIRQRELDRLSGRVHDLEKEIKEAGRRLKERDSKDRAGESESGGDGIKAEGKTVQTRMKDLGETGGDGIKAEEETVQTRMKDLGEAGPVGNQKEAAPDGGDAVLEAAVTAEKEGGEGAVQPGGRTEGADVLAQKAVNAAKKAGGRKGGRR